MGCVSGSSQCGRQDPSMTNSTSLVAPRWSSWSPDLWVPYVLIGSSCVTFLAVHFWCYHKRNRERYLRQREEKQLKFGLMEKRRNASLILARYQSDLGVNSRTIDVDLPQTHGDSNIECVGGDHEDSGHEKPPCTDVTKEDTSTPTTPDLAVAAESTSSHSVDHWPKTSGATTLAHSKSWPLVDDSQNFVGSANTLYPQISKSFRPQGLGQSAHSQSLGQSVRLLSPRDGVRQASPSILASHETSTVNTHEASPDVRHHHSATGSRFTWLRVSNPAASTGRNTRRPAGMPPAQVGVPRQQSASKPRAPPRHRPGVFHSHSSATMPDAAAPFLTWKHSKRRYDGSHVGGGQTVSDHRHTASLTCNHWRHYQAHQSEKIRLTSFYSHGDGTASDNYRYPNGHLNTVIHATRPSFRARNGETSYPRHTHPVVDDTGQGPHISRDICQDPHISRDTGQPPHISRDTGQSPHISRDTGQSPHISRDTGQPPHISRDTGQPPHISRDTGQPPHISRNTGSNRDAGQQAHMINNQSSSCGPSYFCRRDLTGSDSSGSEQLSVTFGKVSGAVDRHPASQVCLAGSQGKVEAEAIRSYISQAGCRIQSQTVPTYDVDHQQIARPHVRLSEHSGIQSVCESVPFLVHRKHICASRQGVQQVTHAYPVSETDIDSTTQT